MRDGFASPRVTVIVNPVAGRRRVGRLRRYLAALADAGFVVVVRETTSRGDAEAMARDLSCRHADLLAVAGGDGTINEVANGLHGESPPLAVIPLGTANVFARELRLPVSPRRLAQVFAAGRMTSIRCGRVGERRFVMMAAAGFDAAVVERVSPALKQALGEGAYVWQIAREWVRGAHFQLEVRIDGAADCAASVIVANGRRYAGPFILAPEADLRTDEFSVVLFRRGTRADVALYLVTLPLGLLHACPGVEIRQVRRIEIMGPAGAPVHADGDIVARLPVDIRMEPHPIRVLVPPSVRNGDQGGDQGRASVVSISRG
jgi:YegS/Rv2252/BmrU family lipid kinase